MAGLIPELEGVTIVLRGAFNPRIFQPAWFAAEDLVRKGEVDASEIEIIHKEISVFSLGKFSFQVMEDRFTARTSDAPSVEPLRDLVLATFRMLRHTPIVQMGINTDAHFKLASEDLCHRLGFKLAPRENWSDLLDEPGMRSLVIQGARPDDHSGYIQVRVEPSTKAEAHPGVFVAVNDHFKYDVEDVTGAEKMMTILEQEFDVSVKRARNIAQEIAGNA